MIDDNDLDVQDDDIQLEERPLECRRWGILVAFCTLTFTNAASFTAYSSIL